MDDSLSRAAERCGALLREGRYRESVEAATAYLACHEDDPGLLMIMVLAEIAEGRSDAASALLDRVLALGAGDLDDRLLLADALVAVERLDEARGVLDQAARTFPGAAPVHRRLACVLAERGDSQAAIIEARRAVAFAPADAEARRVLADCSMRLAIDHLNGGRLGEAEAMARQALANDGSAANGILLAQILDAAGRPGASLATLENAFATGPDDLDAPPPRDQERFKGAISSGVEARYGRLHAARARELAGLDAWADAERLARKAIVLAPSDADARLVLGDALAWRGARDEAACQYRAVLDAEGDRWDACAALARLYRAAGDADRARAFRIRAARALIGDPGTTAIDPALDDGLARQAEDIARRLPPLFASNAGSRIGVFYHVSSSGGASFSDAIRPFFEVGPDDLVAPPDPELPDEEKRRVRAHFARPTPGPKMLTLHFPEPVRNLVDGPVAWMTMLRDPVRRYLSQYFHYLTHFRLNPIEGNEPYRYGRLPLTRLIGADGDVDAPAPEWFRRISVAHLLLAQFPTDARDAGAVAQHLLGVLDREFAFVGITEHFDASLLALSLRLGRDRVPLWRHHALSVTPHLDDLNPAILPRLERLCALDTALYRAARQRFEAAHGDLIALVDDVFGSFHVRDRDRVLSRLRARFGVPGAKGRAA